MTRDTMTLSVTNKWLEEFESFMIDQMPKGKPQTLFAPIRYTIELGGKRVRPLLVMLGAAIAGSDPKAVFHPAMGVEFFHNFTLLHDDIMDEAPIRRGKPTVFRKFGNNTAILSGDAMLVLAYDHIHRVPDSCMENVVNTFTRLSMGVCEGQQLDLDFEDRNDVTIEEYLEMIRLKTAVLLGGALKIGAQAVGASSEVGETLEEIGIDLGLSFQLQDDILDSFGEESFFGKQVGGDIIQNKKTYLLIKALELATDNQRKEIYKWLNSKDAENNPRKISALQELFKTTGTYDAAVSLKESYYQKGLATIDDLSGEENSIHMLRQLAENLIIRTR